MLESSSVRVRQCWGHSVLQTPALVNIIIIIIINITLIIIIIIISIIIIIIIIIQGK